MKRFHFRLERLLDIRSYRERQWLAKLAAASGLCTRLMRKITETGEAARGALQSSGVANLVATKAERNLLAAVFGNATQEAAQSMLMEALEMGQE